MKNEKDRIDRILKNSQISKFPNGFVIDNKTNKQKIRIYLAGCLLHEYNNNQYNSKLVKLFIQKYETIKSELN